tara:strand:+ start:56780 stop:57079 length:300 start_codon:yes stop_codon:yes gene_type:complete
MKAVSPAICEIISQLQSIQSLSDFSLGGGTNLAFQYNHRISEDIDLFYPNIIGKQGFNKVIEEVKSIMEQEPEALMILAILTTNSVLFGFSLIPNKAKQ